MKNSNAKYWNSRYRAFGGVGYPDREVSRSDYANRVRLLRRFIRIGEGMSVLDVGCGDGHWYNLFVKDSLKGEIDYTGIDISPACIDAARRRYPKCHFLVASAASMRVAKKHDVVYSITVLQHITGEELRKSIQNMISATKVNGIVVILEKTVKNQEDGSFYIKGRTREFWIEQFYGSCRLEHEYPLPEAGVQILNFITSICRALLTGKQVVSGQKSLVRGHIPSQTILSPISGLLYRIVKKGLLLVTKPLDVLLTYVPLPAKTMTRLYIFRRIR